LEKPNSSFSVLSEDIGQKSHLHIPLTGQNTDCVPLNRPEKRIGTFSFLLLCKPVLTVAYSKRLADVAGSCLQVIISEGGGMARRSALALNALLSDCLIAIGGAVMDDELHGSVPRNTAAACLGSPRSICADALSQSNMNKMSGDALFDDVGADGNRPASLKN
jgi:hypothetical protein